MNNSNSRYIFGEDVVNYIIENPILQEYGFAVQDGESKVTKEIVWYPYDIDGNPYVGYENIIEVKIILYVDEDIFYGKKINVFYKKRENRGEFFSIVATFDEVISPDEKSEIYLQNPIAYNLINFLMLIVEQK